MTRKPRSRMQSGFPLLAVGRSVDVVGADVDGANAQAVAGLNHLLPVAIADAGVGVETAEAGTPAAVRAPAAPAMHAMCGSGGNGGNAERSRSDQSKSNLPKH